MHFIDFNPKKSKWKVLLTNTDAHAYPGYYVRVMNPESWPLATRQDLKNNFIFDARLRYKCLAHRSYSTYIDFIDIDSNISFYMRGWLFNRFFDLISDDKYPEFSFDGKFFKGRFTFENISGSLYIKPYYSI